MAYQHHICPFCETSFPVAASGRWTHECNPGDGLHVVVTCDAPWTAPWGPEHPYAKDICDECGDYKIDHADKGEGPCTLGANCNKPTCMRFREEMPF
jgi:hypothetical protein